MKATKHPLLIPGYIRELGIHHIPQELIFLINRHIPIAYIQQPTYFFLTKPIKKRINTILKTFSKAKSCNQPKDIYDDVSDNEEEDLYVLFKKDLDTFKRGYSAYLTIKELYIAYDGDKKDYKKGFDDGLREDAMIQYEKKERQRLTEKDDTK